MFGTIAAFHFLTDHRQLEEMMEEHGVEVDHTTLNR
jgi:transposase-like protein